MSCAIIVVALVSLFTLDPARAFPAIHGVSGKELSSVVSFMMSYGYLEPKDPRLGQFRTKNDLITAIKKLQAFSGLKVTGKIDDDTVKMIKTPRCSVPDFGPSDKMRRRKRYALHDSVWRKTDLTYRILNIPTSELNKHHVKTTIRAAFDKWSEVSPLEFKQIHSGEADIMISFEAGNHGDGYPFDGRGNTIAHAFYPHDNAGEDGDVHFDDEEHWTLDKPDVGTDFMWTAVHEIGHAIGIDHSSDFDAIMYPYYTGYKPNLELQEDDVMAVQAKYGSGRTEVPTSPPTLDPEMEFRGASPCDTSFDAVVRSGDGNTYFFKEPHFWTLDKYNRPLGGRPIVDHFPGLRSRVQAAYTRRDGLTVFFKGRKYWVFNGTKPVSGPKVITDYGLPLELKRLDAAFTWGGNGKTYFFKGDKYWRYNERMGRIDQGYPKNISEGWGPVVGGQHPIDAAMTWNDGNTYFFNGLYLSKYDFHQWDKYEPKKVSEFFFKSRCHDDRDGIVAAKDGDMESGVLKTSVFAPLIALLAVFASFFNC